MRTLSTFTMSCCACAALIVASPGQAQETAQEQQMQTIQVTGVKDPAIMPYKTLYELIGQINRLAQGRVQLMVRVTSKKTGAPLPDLEIVLDGQQTHQKLSISSEGLLTIPLDQLAYDEGAEFVSNKKKGTMRIDFFLVPKLPAENLRYADLVDTLRSAQLALDEAAKLMPWYLRFLMPSIRAIGICYPDVQQTVAIGGAGTTRAATSAETAPMEQKVFCASFSAKENAIAGDSLIVPAVGWQAIFR